MRLQIVRSRVHTTPFTRATLETSARDVSTIESAGGNITGGENVITVKRGAVEVRISAMPVSALIPTPATVGRAGHAGRRERRHHRWVKARRNIGHTEVKARELIEGHRTLKYQIPLSSEVEWAVVGFREGAARTVLLWS